MSEQLSPNFTIQTKLGGSVTNPRFLGEGGQGSVYKVTYNGKDMALKWYKPGSLLNKEAFYENIWQNIMRGSPADEFLWPVDITEWSADNETFGYVMELRPSGYYDLTDFMNCQCRFPDFRKAIEAAMRIVSAFRILHNDGYSYQDLNDGNFFINPDTGKVLICDNDNVAPDGTETGIVGKPRYMAPEIVNGKMPNMQSDSFSMAVILYILFCLNHPLEGKRSCTALSPALQKKLYGTEPLFIMDPDDQRNGPDPVIHKNTIAVWNCLPSYMQKVFLDAFSQAALKEPHRRPAEIVWLKTLTRFRSDIVVCKQCGNEIFTQDAVPSPCDRCGAIPDIPVKITLSEYSVPAVKTCRIYRCQLGICNEKDALDPVASIVEKKSKPGVLGIRNRSGKRWYATTTKGEKRKVDPDEAVPLKPGIVFEIDEETMRLEENRR